MQPPRLVFVSHTGAVSGAERVLIDVVKAFPDSSAFVFEDGALAGLLRSSGLSVKVAVNGQSLAGVRRSNSLFSAMPLLGSLARLIWELRGETRQFDVIYANSQKAFTLSALSCVFTRKTLVWHLHDILSAAHFGAKQLKMQVFLANRFAKLVIVPSVAAADAFVAAGGRASLVKVVANGVTAASESRSKLQLRADLSLPDGPLIGVFSRLAAWKGQEIVIRAVARCPEVTAIIAGDALFGERAYAGRLKQLVRELNLESRVQFLGQRGDVQQLMRAMDIVVHPSVDAEPFGLTLVEAMLAHVPVIASNAGASSEILESGKAGGLVAAGDVDALAAAIQNVIADAPRLAPQLDYAQKRAETVYAVAGMQNSIRNLLQNVAPRGLS